MYFDEADAGDFRIYAGAVEKPRQYGYVAAVVVVRVRGRQARRIAVREACREEAYRDEALAGGFAWATPREALRFAIDAGRDAVMCRIGAPG